MATQKRQISSLLAQNQKMIAAITASGIDIPDSDPSSGEEDENKDRKMAANKKNSNLTKTNKRRK